MFRYCIVGELTEVVCCCGGVYGLYVVSVKAYNKQGCISRTTIIKDMEDYTAPLRALAALYHWVM